MPNGKPAGVKCVHLTDDLRCSIYGDPRRPQVCTDFVASLENCGSSQQEALQILSDLEQATR
jgi:hypothetical protein